MAGSGTSQAAGGLPPPLAVLYERAGLPAWPLPRVLAEVYGGDLGFRQPCVYANFVASVDGVTALGPEYPSSGSAISVHDPADRFVMGLLRACADMVLIGAGTLRATPGHRWTPAYVCPAAADGYAALRRTRGLPIDPLLAVVTARGDIPAGHPALRAGALILTTAAGARRLHGRLPPRCTILDLGDQPELSPADVLAAARARGGSMVLTEGGPRLLGQLAVGGLLDELFLTVSPVLAGAANMLPASTGAALATTKALPGLAGRFDGVAIRVPIPVGSIADVVAVTARPVTREEVNDAFREEAATDRYRGILGVTDDPVVSADIIGDPRASVVDAAMTRVVDGTLVKVMSWYDNEWGFTCQMIREAFTALGLPAPDLSQIRP